MVLNSVLLDGEFCRATVPVTAGRSSGNGARPPTIPRARQHSVNRHRIHGLAVGRTVEGGVANFVLMTKSLRIVTSPVCGSTVVVRRAAKLGVGTGGMYRAFGR